MNSKELKKQLQQMGISENLYNLDGIGRMDERFCLDFSDGIWYVFFCERGIKTTNKKFISEDEACEFILEQLSQ